MLSPTLGQVLREAFDGPLAASLNLSPHQWKILRALAACRTGALGGQLFRCTRCNTEHFVAHSCRNRHCPQCQGALSAEWLEKQAAALLPIPYFHLVFTLPHCLNGLIRQNPKVLFKLLFDAASQTLLEFGQNRFKGQIGVTAVLHTWSQTLLDHYHLHCIVTGGAITATRWKPSSEHYLFPVKALSLVFRGKFMAGFKRLFDEGRLEFHGQMAPLEQPARFDQLLRQAVAQRWVVYAKRPFAGPRAVLAYLSRYTHRVAISNRRLISSDGATVTFTYKDYADGARIKTMSLNTHEFVRRFCLHVLPQRFVKIRHYGLLGNRTRKERLERARQLLGAAAPAQAPALRLAPGQASSSQRNCCPLCRQPALVLVCEVRPHRAASRMDSS
ncbi:MAG: IS91 family transposase [Rhodoferax sp.]|nr:IS91 family transposase [Rhodoferax sp.]